MEKRAYKLLLPLNLKRRDIRRLGATHFHKYLPRPRKLPCEGEIFHISFQIARNILINEYRQSARRPQSVELETDFTDDKNSDMETAELEEIFELAIAEMPENQRTAILLLKQQGFTYDEIAKTMDASVGAVKTWIFRARATLRNALRERKA